MHFTILLVCSFIFSGFTLKNRDVFPADSVAAPDRVEKDHRLRASVRLHPGNLWLTRIGLGFGATISLRNLGVPGVMLRTTAMPSQHRGLYHAALYSSDPAGSPLYAMAGVGYKTTGVQGFYGLGPASRRRDLILITQRSSVAEIRLGYHPLLDQGSRRFFLVQPLVRFSRQRIGGYREAEAGAFDRLSAEAREHLLVWTNKSISFLTYGLEFEFDMRDRLAKTHRGLVVQGSGLHTTALQSGDVSFNRFSAGAYGFIPMGTGRVLALGMVSEVSRSAGGGSIPFYHLSRFDQLLAGGFARDRFTGNDLLYLSAEYRFSVLRLLNVYDVSASAMVGAGNIYDNLPLQFSPSLSFSSIFSPEASRVPLRPTFGIGLRLANLVHDRLVLDSTFGVSTEGYQILTIRFVPDLRGMR